MRCTGKLREKKIRFARSLINDGNVPIFSGFKITICMFPSRKFTNAKITMWTHRNEMNSQLDGMPNDCKSMAFEMIIFSIVHWLPWREIWADFFSMLFPSRSFILTFILLVSFSVSLDHFHFTTNRLIYLLFYWAMKLCSLNFRGKHFNSM